MASDLSILADLKKGKYEASIITSFNTYLPFYEEVVLRRLLAVGCRHNVLLVDSQQLAKSAGDPRHQPRLAGSEYTLAPISITGAFHPKLILLAGAKAGALFVGSHNLTLAGFTYNRELTNKVIVKKPFEAIGVDQLAAAWAFVEAWISNGGASLPEEVREAILGVRRFAPWLKAKGAASDDLSVVGSTPDGPPLWESIRQYRPGNVRRVVTLGAFFDREFEFLKSLKRDLDPEEIILAVQPSTVMMPSRQKLPDGVRVVDASALYRGSGYLHAKALSLESEDGAVVLITGSANPSYPAWLGGKGNRNAELVAIRKGAAAGEVFVELGLNRVPGFSELTNEDWASIDDRVEVEGPQIDVASRTIAHAIEIDGGLELRWSPTGAISDIRVFDAAGRVLFLCEGIKPENGKLLIPLDSTVKRAASRVEASMDDGRLMTAYVHHTQVIRGKTSTSKQADLRTALADLNSDHPDLARLIMLIEKTIFEAHDSPQPPKPPPKDPTGGAKPTDEQLESLAITLAQARKTRKRKRVIDTGDLGYLLDVLIYQLGVGFDRSSEQVDHLGRNEEELIGSDDDEPRDDRANDTGSEEVDPKELIKACCQKVTMLVSRMIGQLKKAAKGSSNAVIATTQLVAVLSILRELRTVETTAKWVPPGAFLVPLKQSRRLFDESLGVLYGRGFMLMQKALIEAGPEPADEISKLRGLLVWLAWDAGAVLQEERGFGETAAELKRRITEKARFLVTAPDAASDGVAFDEAFESVLRCSLGRRHGEAETWLERHLEWGQSMSERIEKLDRGGPPPKNRPKPGDIVVPPKSKTGMPRVVLSSDAKFVRLIDLGQKDTISFDVTKVVAVH